MVAEIGKADTCLGLRATLLLAGAGAILLVPVVAWLSPLARMRRLSGLAEG